MAKLFKAEAARERYNCSKADRMFNNLIKKISDTIEEACPTVTYINILMSNGFEELMFNSILRNKIIDALDKAGYLTDLKIVKRNNKPIPYMLVIKW